MPIDFSCQSCGQSYRVKDEFAGRTTKCRKCSQPVTVPEPAPPELEPLGALGSLLDDELGSEPVRAVAAAAPGPTMSCPSCSAVMPAAATLCVQCGYDIATGTKRSTERPARRRGRARVANRPICCC